MTDTLELKLNMLKKGHTINSLAKEIGMSGVSLSYKINNIREFKSSEIKKIQDVLCLSDVQRDAIFFAIDVD